MWVIDITFVPILVYILLVVLFFALVSKDLIRYRRYLKTMKKKPQKVILTVKDKLPAADPWEKDFVESLRSAHHVLRIETATVTFLGKADTARDGFRWICKCGAHDSSLTLEAAGRNYQRHLTLEADKAAAQLGKFELPAGISWDTKVFERKE